MVLGAAAVAAADDPPVYRGAAEVTGPAMLRLEGKRILLWGVDAPVRGQPCYAGNKTWDCATASAKTLLNLVGNQGIACEQRRIDQFGRVFAVSMGLNIAGLPVGSALAGPVVERSVTVALIVAAVIAVVGCVTPFLLIPRER